jgi:hypothetical protein
MRARQTCRETVDRAWSYSDIDMMVVRDEADARFTRKDGTPHV